MTDVPRKSLTLVAQRPELSHVGFAQCRPIMEETCHALIAAAPCLLDLLVAERRQVPGKAFDDGRTSRAHSDAPKPRGTSRGRLSSPSHFRIFAAKLRTTCTRASLSAALDAMAGAVKAEREARKAIVAAPARGCFYPTPGCRAPRASVSSMPWYLRRYVIDERGRLLGEP